MLRPEVIEGRSGRLLCVVHAPTGAPAPRAIVIVPPFAEEMNKSRRMMTLFGEAAAPGRFETVVPDLSGCGDSDGNFEDARWDLWCDDLRRVIDRAARRTGQPPVLLAIRSGALLASALLERDRHAASDLVLWAPVGDGERFMRQFLRLRVAASLAQTNRETVAGLEEILRSGQVLEVGGYPLAPGLWADFSARRLEPQPPPAGGRLFWFDVLAAEPCQLSPASQKAAAAWQAAGWRVQARALLGPAFWATAEIAELPELIAASAAALDGVP